MKIITKIGGRYRNCERTSKLFHLYKSRINQLLPVAIKNYKPKLPDELILRPFYTRNGFCEYYGRLRYQPFTGWSILMNVDDCAAKPDFGLSVVDHEVAHLVMAVKYDDWGHGDEWKECVRTLRGYAGSEKATRITGSPVMQQELSFRVSLLSKWKQGN